MVVLVVMHVVSKNRSVISCSSSRSSSGSGSRKCKYSSSSSSSGSNISTYRCCCEDVI